MLVIFYHMIRSGASYAELAKLVLTIRKNRVDLCVADCFCKTEPLRIGLVKQIKTGRFWRTVIVPVPVNDNHVPDVMLPDALHEDRRI